MRDHDIFTGDDGETAYLLTVQPDGTAEVAVRPVTGVPTTWSTPVALAAVPAEVCS